MSLQVEKLEKNMANLSERMRTLRKSNGWNQEKTAQLRGIRVRSYRRYELGEREPGVMILWKLADLYGVSIDYLVGRSDEKGTQ